MSDDLFFGGDARILHDRVRQEDENMQSKFWRVLVLAVASATVSGCTPLLIGAAGAVIVDEVMEQEQGGDGLF
ncbi:MAG: hypothetical protein L3J30_03255 [Marinosulfonomonas sp.]|nr:hypothetical protein [Marinosulfonomonas sp.]